MKDDDIVCEKILSILLFRLFVKYQRNIFLEVGISEAEIYLLPDTFLP
ncbi:MAG: hypothetical protein LBE18_12740 [Planctomycetaceae bacterium]|nr:hypothetical protein [Planctomycetaceae bacterium]